MKPYFIFAIVVTAIYIIYYAVIIVQDIYGKQGMDKPDEEVFDLDIPEEESVIVTESETGFNVGEEEYETESGISASPSEREENRTDKQDVKETIEEKMKRLKAQAEEQMEGTTGYLSDAYTADELYKAMLAKGKTDNRPELVWKPIKDQL